MPGLFHMLVFGPPEDVPAAETFVREWQAEPDLDATLSEAFRRRLPPADLRQRYREHFLAFRDFHGADALEAPGQLVAKWLLELAAVQQRPLTEVQQAAQAITYYQDLHRGAAYIDAALLIAAETDGKELGGEKAPAETDALQH